MAEEQVQEEVVETQEVVEETTEQPTAEATEEVTEQAFVDSMLSQIDDDDVKSAGFWKNLEGKDANEVGKYIKELQSFAGKKGDIPTKDASEEEWNDFYAKMGRPESIEGYDFNINDDFKELVGEEAVPFFEQAIDGFKEQAFKLGASTDQADELVDWYLGQIATDVQETNKVNEAHYTEQEAEVKKEWGDSYDGMNDGIKAMLMNNGMSAENIESLGITGNAALAKTLGNISKSFADDVEIGHHHTNTMAGLKDQLFDVNQQIKELLGSTGNIPQHIQDKRLDLMRKLGDNL
tara:strand:- start:65 stop:943 length:879 start_codon:yes stop_codon:yes gene_type:complete